MAALPATQVAQQFNAPTVYADNARFAGPDGFAAARDIALAQAFALMQGVVLSAHQAIVAQDNPTSYQIVEVAPFGQSVIIQEIAYSYMDDVAQFALQTLRSHSPVGSGSDPHPGLYRDSHMMFIDGQSVKDATGWLPGQTLFISNPVPWARKIELGTMKMSVPGHVYETCQPIIASKFQDSVDVKFIFMPVRFGNSGDFRKFSKRSRSGSERARADWLAAQPALQITAR